jgi:hypothetical protein
MVTWQLTIDCNDPARLVRFWAPLLGYEVQPPPALHATWNDYYRSVGVPDDELDLSGDGTDRIFDPTGRGPRVWFQVVPERKSGKNRLHLDIYPGGRDLPIDERKPVVEAKVAELIEAGATVARRYPADFDTDAVTDYFVTMLDPEGNEFCVG